MAKRPILSVILLALVSSILLGLLDSFLAQYYYPRQIIPFVLTLSSAIIIYLVTNFTVFIAPVFLFLVGKKILGNRWSNKLEFIVLAPFVAAFLIFLFVPDLYEITLGDGKYFLAGLIGTVLYLGLYYFLLTPNYKKLAVTFSIILAIYGISILSLSTSKLYPSSGHKPDPKRPNFILIVFDAMRADTAGSIGHKAKTPNLDKFFEEGIAFTNAFSNGPDTSISMPSLFAARYPSALRIRNTKFFSIPADYRVITEDLAEKGYYNYAIIGNHRLGESSGIQQGFEKNIHISHNNLNNQYTVTLPIYNRLWGNSKDLVHRAIKTIAEILVINPYRVTSEFLVELAIEFLENPPKEPFFFWLHLMDPHSPYTPPNYKSDYSGSLPKDFFAPDTFHPTAGEIIRGKYFPTKEDKQHIENLYYAEMEYLDEIIAPLLDKIRTMDDTIVVIAADHGESFWEHGDNFFHGRDMFPPTLHVPLLFYGQDLPKGKLISAPVTNINIMPTVRELLNMPPGKGEDGQSLVNLFFDKPVDIKPNFIEKDDRKGAVVLFDYYYLSEKFPSGEVYLFDLKNDPLCRDDISDKYPNVVSSGIDLIDSFKKGYLSAPKRASPKDKETIKDLTDRLRSLGYIQ